MNKTILNPLLETRKQESHGVRPYRYSFKSQKNKDNISWGGYEVTWVRKLAKAIIRRSGLTINLMKKGNSISKDNLSGITSQVWPHNSQRMPLLS